MFVSFLQESKRKPGSRTPKPKKDRSSKPVLTSEGEVEGDEYDSSSSKENESAKSAPNTPNSRKKGEKHVPIKCALSAGGKKCCMVYMLNLSCVILS